MNLQNPQPPADNPLEKENKELQTKIQQLQQHLVPNKTSTGPANRAGSNTKAYTADKKKQIKLMEEKE